MRTFIFVAAIAIAFVLAACGVEQAHVENRPPVLPSGELQLASGHYGTLNSDKASVLLYPRDWSEDQARANAKIVKEASMAGDTLVQAKFNQALVPYLWEGFKKDCIPAFASITPSSAVSPLERIELKPASELPPEAQEPYAKCAAAQEMRLQYVAGVSVAEADLNQKSLQTAQAVGPQNFRLLNKAKIKISKSNKVSVELEDFVVPGNNINADANDLKRRPREVYYNPANRVLTFKVHAPDAVVPGQYYHFMLVRLQDIVAADGKTVWARFSGEVVLTRSDKEVPWRKGSAQISGLFVKD